jgi:hypothetical protein
MGRFQKTINSEDDFMIEEELEITKETNQKIEGQETIKFENKNFDIDKWE